MCFRHATLALDADNCTDPVDRRLKSKPQPLAIGRVHNFQHTRSQRRGETKRLRRVVMLGRCLGRVAGSSADLDMYVSQWRHVVLKGTVETGPDLVGLGHGQARVDMDGRLHVHAVAEPPDPYVGETLDAGHMRAGVDHLVDDARFHTVQHARQHGARRLPHDAENGEGDEDADDGIGERKAEPNAESAGYYRQAGEAVDPGVVTVRDQRALLIWRPTLMRSTATASLPTKPTRPATATQPSMRDRLGMEQAVDGLIAGHQRAERE